MIEITEHRCDAALEKKPLLFDLMFGIADTILLSNSVVAALEILGHGVYILPAIHGTEKNTSPHNDRYSSNSGFVQCLSVFGWIFPFNEK